MKRVFSVAMILALSVTALAATLFTDYARANPIVHDPETVSTYVQSPTKNKVYNTTNIPLKFYVDIPAESKVLSVRYWLDGQLLGQDSGEDLPKAYSVALTWLSDGKHSIKVYMNVHYFKIWRMSDGNVYHISSRYLDGYSDAVLFTVDTRSPSARVIASQETFEASDVPLNFTLNEPVSWVGYSLDGNNVVTVTDDVASTEWLGVGNYRLVLSGLPAGAHSLTVYAEDLAGNRGASEPFNFTVAQETPSEVVHDSTPFPTAFAAAGILTAVVAVSSGLLFYFKKRRH